MNKPVARAIVAITFALAAAAGYAQDAKHSSHAPATAANVAQLRAYMIANYTIHDQATFQKYMDAAGSIAPRYNGKVTIFNLNAKKVEGNPQTVIAVAEFPSLADAERFYNSPEYSEAKKLRIASTEGSVVITEGLPPQQ
jgi:uncharacterized protein (DUF1330 family)